MLKDRSRAARRFAAAALALVAGVAGAQVYRIIGPDGRVTYSDQPPPADAKGQARPGPAVAGGQGGSGTASLPYELRQVTARYPVTFYSGPECAPCGSARVFLNARGIPFTEKTVSTQDDVSALQRLSGNVNLPFLTIGGQQLSGYSEAEWTQFLDAAGYPRSSQLPPGYRQAAATPLVVVAKPVAAAPDAAAQSAPQARTTPTAPSEPPPNNPAGIQF